MMSESDGEEWEHMTGKEILEEEFERAGMRGYRADQVDVFLQKVAAYVDEQEQEKNDLMYKMQILADKIAEYKADEENIREALLGAQKLGSSIVNEAKTKAETITQEAKASSDEMLAQAKAKVDSMMKESLQKVNLDLSSIRRECEMEQRRFELLKQEVSNFRASLLKQYKTHLDLLSNLPSVEKKDTESAAKKPEAVSAETEVAEEMQPPLFTEEVEETTETEESFADEEAVEDEAPTEEPAILFTKTQTIKSEIFSDTAEQEIAQEEQEHTKEFHSDRTHIEAGKTNEEDPFFKPKYGTNHRAGGRPSYIEKFGELKFGGFGENDK